MKHLKKFNEAIIDYNSDNIKGFYDDMVKELQKSKPEDTKEKRQKNLPKQWQGFRREPEVSFQKTVEIGLKHDISVVKYDDFYNGLREVDKKTAPPKNAPAFALVDTNNKAQVVLNVPGVDMRLLDHIYHMLKHETVHIGQFSKRGDVYKPLADPSKPKEYFSDKDEVMAFSQSIVDMLKGRCKSKQEAIKQLKYNQIYNEIRRNVDIKTLQRYKKYIYLYLDKEFQEVK